MNTTKFVTVIIISSEFCQNSNSYSCRQQTYIYMIKRNANKGFSVIHITNIFIQAKLIIGLHRFKTNTNYLKSQHMDYVIRIFHCYLKRVHQ